MVSFTESDGMAVPAVVSCVTVFLRMPSVVADDPIGSLLHGLFGFLARSFTHSDINGSKWHDESTMPGASVALEKTIEHVRISRAKRPRRSERVRNAPIEVAILASADSFQCCDSSQLVRLHPADCSASEREDNERVITLVKRLHMLERDTGVSDFV